MPGALCPNCASNQSEAPRNETNHVESIGDPLQLLQIGELIHNCFAPTSILDEIKDVEAGSNREKAHRQNCNHYVND